jgi:hypothetical protein
MPGLHYARAEASRSGLAPQSMNSKDAKELKASLSTRFKGLTRKAARNKHLEPAKTY